MKKLLFFLMSILILNTHIFSQTQSAFYDAKFLRDSCFSVPSNSFIHPKNLKAVFKKYYSNIIDSTTSDDILISDLSNNPFFKEFTPNNFVGSVDLASTTFKNFVTSPIGSLNVTKYANAIADLMIERAKQELTIAFFNRFKKFAEDNPEFKILFPKTMDNLSILLTYTYPQMLPKLRDGFFEDLKQVTYNLEAVLELPRYRTLFKNFPEIRVAIRSLKLLHRLENGESTDSLFLKFAAFPEWTEDNTKESVAFKNTAATIQFAALLSESLRSTATTRIWISSKEANDLVNDEIFAKIYLGLLYQEISNENLVYFLDSKHPTNSTPFKDLFAKQKDNILLMQNKISQFISLAEKVNDAYATIKEKNKPDEKNTSEDYFNYIGISIDIVEYGFGIVKIFDDNFKTDNYITVAKKSNSLYKDIYGAQYTLAVSDAMDILKNIDTLIHEKNISASTKDPVDGALTAKEALDKFSTFIDKLEPYAIFMGNMVEAKDEKEVKAALENVVLPVGSSTIKKNTSGWSGNIAIQSYLGAYGTIHSPASLVQSAWTDKFGVTAPIGIAWTPGCLSWRRGGSISVFASLFDIGAIVDYKLKKDSTINANGSKEQVVSKDYEIQLGQILSPGGFLVYGFPWNLPLSLGFGAQYGPGLSKIDAGGNTVITNPSVRWNLFLAVDIPVFNLKNKINLKPF
jgi:hypothetical protein